MDTEAALSRLDAAFVALDEEDLDAARPILEEVQAAQPELPELWLLWGELHRRREDLDAAKAAFLQALEIDPEYADAHYHLARALEEAGERDAMVEHDLLVLGLDAAADAEIDDEDRESVTAIIEGEAERVLAELPDRFAGALSEVPVILDARPDEALVRTGFDPRALGLFEGPTQRERSSTETPPAPTRIVLFWTNLLDVSDDEETLRAEVEITLLHEIGHYFDLDEDDVARLGLA